MTDVYTLQDVVQNREGGGITAHYILPLQTRPLWPRKIERDSSAPLRQGYKPEKITSLRVMGHYNKITHYMRTAKT